MDIIPNHAVYTWPRIVFILVCRKCIFLPMLPNNLSINLKFRSLSSMSGPDMDQGPLVQYLKCSVTQFCPTFCNAMDCSTACFHFHHQLQELAQTQVHSVSDAIQPSHPLLSPSPAFNLSCIMVFSNESVLHIR